MLPVYAVVVSWSLLAQGPGANPAPTPASYFTDPMVASLKWPNIGNANLVGRLSAIDAPPGEYRVTMTANGKTYTTKLTVREDPLLNRGR